MWHVVHTAPNAELQVSRVLELYGLSTYMPRFRPSRGTRPDSVRGRRPRLVFPGYVFFRPPDGFARWPHVRSAPGVRRVLDEDGEPALMRDELVEHLRRRIAALPPDSAGQRFMPGQRVRVQQGPLAMVDALFERDVPARERVTILVQLLGRQLPVEVERQALRAAG